MRSAQDLSSSLRRIDGKGYKAYKDIQGGYDLGSCILSIDQVQSDPFAPPSRLRVSIDQSQARIPEEMWSTPGRKVAAEDYLTRSFAQVVGKIVQNERGTGKSGILGIDRPGQEILPRTSMRITAQRVEARFVLGLPARGRTVLGRQAADILLKKLPGLATEALCFSSLDAASLRWHVQVCEDQEVLRQALAERGLVAFVANGAVLPRQSGVSDRPLRSASVLPFTSPLDMQVEFHLPNQGRISGMGVPQGVTLIVGGGYHGKSTLLRALERSVYNHIPGDGREYVVTDASGVKIRAEDGRSVTGVDIEPFITHLPLKQDTSNFFSDNASGSTSQAANIIEALEAGSNLLLLDEDTSATNFMIRDSRMQRLVASEFEPITPFIDRVQDLWTHLQVSTVLVLGGSGDYLDVADTVIMLSKYRAENVTNRAREVASQLQTERAQEAGTPWQAVSERRLDHTCLHLGPRDKVKAKGRHGVHFGRELIDLSQVEQIVDESQTRALAAILRHLSTKEAGKAGTLRQAVEAVLQEVYSQDVDVLCPSARAPVGDLALPRREDICAAINRLRSLRVRQATRAS